MSDGLTYHGPINPNPGPGESRIVIYTYIPSLILAIVGVITFAAIFVVNIYHVATKHGPGYRAFHILMIVGSAMEAGGYGIRIGSHNRPFLVGFFVGQYFLIVVAPVLFSAAIYLSLTLLVRRFHGAEHLLLVPQKWILAFFISADVVCTVIQVAGAALIGVTESRSAQGTPSNITPKQANDILLSGLVCQCFSFLDFLIILSVATYRAYRPALAASGLSTVDLSPLKTMLSVIMITAVLILLRTVFRMAETAEGFFGTAATNEGLFGGLEYAPVILALIVWAIFPPSRFLDLEANSATESSGAVVQGMAQHDKKPRDVSAGRGAEISAV